MINRIYALEWHWFACSLIDRLVIYYLYLIYYCDYFTSTSTRNILFASVVDLNVHIMNTTFVFLYAGLIFENGEMSHEIMLYSSLVKLHVFLSTKNKKVTCFS